jgi:hypothetical protein
MDGLVVPRLMVLFTNIVSYLLLIVVLIEIAHNKKIWHFPNFWNVTYVSAKSIVDTTFYERLYYICKTIIGDTVFLKFCSLILSLSTFLYIKICILYIILKLSKRAFRWTLTQVAIFQTLFSPLWKTVETSIGPNLELLSVMNVKKWLSVF